jgi:hypothetical protein
MIGVRRRRNCSHLRTIRNRPKTKRNHPRSCFRRKSQPPTCLGSLHCPGSLHCWQDWCRVLTPPEHSALRVHSTRPARLTLPRRHPAPPPA